VEAQLWRCWLEGGCVDFFCYGGHLDEFAAPPAKVICHAQRHVIPGKVLCAIPRSFLTSVFVLAHDRSMKFYHKTYFYIQMLVILSLLFCFAA